MITTAKSLRQLVDRALKTDAVGLDTEFIWERTYYPKLGLVQLALSDEECYLLDPLALDDLSPLGELLGSPNVIKIFHDAPQDLAILYQATGITPRNIFDTRHAAGFAGFPGTLSLSNLLNQLLDINLPKTETRTNWLRRPLKRKQEEYALDDVRYLRAARVVILGLIINDQVKEWLRDDLRRFDNPHWYQPVNDDRRYMKIKGSTGLSHSSLAILRELAQWREQEARKRNLPRGHLISDRALLTIAREKLTDEDEIAAQTELSAKFLERYRTAITECTQLALSLPDSECPPSLHPARLKKKEKRLLQDLHGYIVLKSDVLGIDPNIICSNSELRDFVFSDIKKQSLQTTTKISGWRRLFLQDILAQLMPDVSPELVI